MADVPPKLTCDGWCNQTNDVAMIDEKGFAYCTPCGQRRRESGRRCRKLRPHELNRLRAGLTIPSYD